MEPDPNSMCHDYSLGERAYEGHDFTPGRCATLSTTVAGLVADHLGVSAAFLSLAAVGLMATVLVATVMPETRAPMVTAVAVGGVLETVGTSGWSRLHATVMRIRDIATPRVTRRNIMAFPL